MSDTLRLEYLDPKELEENPANWRGHPEKQINALRDVIDEVGWAGALLYNEATGRLIDGHARKKIANGGKVPVLIGSWTEEQEKKILATLDPLAAMAEADKDKLDALLREVQTGSEAIGAMLEGLATVNGIIPADNKPDAPEPEIDRAAELQAKWQTETGQLWQIGQHRLLCGDSTNREDVERLMQGEKADLVFTSPPYAQQRDYKKKIDDWDSLMQGVFGSLPAHDKTQVLVNLGLVHRDGEWWPYWDGWIEWMRGQGWRRFGWYVWDQGWGLPGDWNGRLAPSHEFVFHFNRKQINPQKCVETKSASQKKGKQSRKRMEAGEFVPATRGVDGKVKEMSSANTLGQVEKVPDSVIRIPRSVVNDIARKNHPATFPPALPSLAISSWPGITYDPFLGSGTTLVACEREGRTGRGLEISPEYCAVILERMSQMGLECKQV